MRRSLDENTKVGDIVYRDDPEAKRHKLRVFIVEFAGWYVSMKETTTLWSEMHGLRACAMRGTRNGKKYYYKEEATAECTPS